MSERLDIHPATPDEIVAAHTNVYDVWSQGRSPEAHLRYRLESPTHSRARWYVGTLDGRVVTSLGCYPIRFRIEGEDLPGIAIGSVHTLSEVRGRGFAPQLIDWVERDNRNAALSVLFSDIQPEYYARIGYVLCPSLEGWVDPQSSPLPLWERVVHEVSRVRGQSVDEPIHRLVPFDPQARLADMQRLYAEYHGAAPLSVSRNADYWNMMLEKFATDTFHALTATDSNTWLGYLRIGRKDDAWRITDYALADQSDSLAEAMYAAFLTAARAGGATRAGGWLPDSPAAKKHFSLTPRRTEITMFKPLAWRGSLSSAAIAATSRMAELDHV